MTHDDCSRRQFLKKFAVLSAGSLMLGATAMACYGVGAINSPGISPTVTGMFFLDATSSRQLLQNNLNVPVQTKFIVEFDVLMDTAVAATILFTDHNNASVPFDKTWDTGFTVAVIPSSNLLFNTSYTLRVQDARDKDGNRLVQTGDGEASFKTVVS